MDGERARFLRRYEAKRFSPSEPIKGLGLTMLDYWAWAYSDVLENTQRATFAEFLVGAVLGVVDGVRIGWGGWDLSYRGKLIEVKASAYLQTWNQRKLSRLSFRIAKRLQLDEDGITYVGDPVHASDCFVFCLFADKDADSADILDVDRWRFKVVASAEIARRFGDQKSVGWNTLSDHRELKLDQLRSELDAVLGFAPLRS